MYPETNEQHGEEERQRNTWRRGTGCTRHQLLPVVTCILFLLIAVPAAADVQGSTTNPTAIIADYSVTPAVLMPGDQGTVLLHIKNTAESASVKENTGVSSGGTFATTKNTDINIFIENVHLEGNGIEVLNRDFDRIGELGPGQSVPVMFVIRAPSKSGIYFPEAWIDVRDGRSTRYPLTVNVNTDISTQKKPALTVLQELPDSVAPGDDCTAGITITNTGLLRASDITATINSTTKSLVLKTPGRYYAEHLDPGESVNLTPGFATDKNTPLGIGPVMLHITYRNPDGSTEQQAETIGIPVKGQAELSIKSFSTDPVRPVPGNPFTLVIRVENTGTDQATSVRALLDSPFPGTGTAFIGSIDKESDAPAVFYLQAARDGSVPVNITVRYTDDSGDHAITEQASVTTGPAGGMTLALAALLFTALIAGAAYWYFRIRTVKKNGE